MFWVKRAVFVVTLLVVMMVLIGVGVAAVQGKQKPKTNARYVALGSSFAAGIGLGERAPSSPFVCQRSVNGYPQQLGQLMGYPMVDMTCSGATIEHVLNGGQLFQGPQIDALGPDTELVTITAGGNDIDYVGDIAATYYRSKGGVFAFVIDRLWHGALPVEERKFARLKNNMVSTFEEIARRSPRARIVVISYPTLLPPQGTCAQVGVSDTDAALMQAVGARLVEVTHEAAQRTGAIFVDLATLSSGHDICSADPWVNGATPEHGTPFHPNFAGAQATANRIQRVLKEKP